MKNIICIFFLNVFLGISLKAQNEIQRTYERHWEQGYEKIRIISYNVFNGFDWKKDKDRQNRFVEWIRKQDPEILALQELCGFTQESLLAIAQQWGHPYAVILKENGYPVGITSKKPINLKAKLLENCGHGLLHVETYGYDILVTHLNPGDTDKRRAEAGFIVQYIKEKTLDKCLLMGDMNAHSPFDADYMEANAIELLMKYGGKQSHNLLDGNFDYSVISRFLSLPFIDVCRCYVPEDKRTTFPTAILMYLSRHQEVRKRVGERLDFILATPLIAKEVTDAFIYNEKDTDYLSDHYPVGIDLCIKDKQDKI